MLRRTRAALLRAQNGDSDHDTPGSRINRALEGIWYMLKAVKVSVQQTHPVEGTGPEKTAGHDRQLLKLGPQPGIQLSNQALQ
jgi:hypothetical protein